MSEHLDQFGTDAALRHEQIVVAQLDALRFNNLVATAEQLCLSKPLPDEKYISPIPPEMDIIARLGVIGLRCAIEAMEYGDMDTQAHRQGLLPIHPLREPELFSGPLNREQLAKATAFGNALIEESYGIIGDDADVWLDEYASAKSDEEQIVVLEKLHERLRSLGQDTRGIEDDDSDLGSYHPIRLSPKLIGRYPNHVLPPTCLGVATIGAGFLKKAGAEFMHAGVAESALQSDEYDLLGLIKQTGEVCSILETPLPDNIVARLDAKSREIMDAMVHDTGTHSVLLVRLMSGAWYQLDPNLNSSMTVPGLSREDESDTIDDRKTLDKAYGNLTHFRDIAPGLEIGAALPRGSFHQLWPEYIANLGPLSEEGIKAVVSSGELAVSEAIRNCVVGNYLLRQVDDFSSEFILNQYLRNFAYTLDDGTEELMIDSVARDTIAAFVFDDLSEEEWLNRYETDETFRCQALEDIKRLPALIGITYGLELIGGDPVYAIHSKMELGLPEVSIGLAVLHNIGIHVANDLSVIHWLSLWPSNTIPPDMLYKKPAAPLQKQMLQNRIRLLAHRSSFAFSHSYVNMYMSYLDNVRNLADIEEPEEVQNGKEGREQDT